ncbi:D-alanyl-D-alanine carboxypeptidase [Rhizobiales bacterium RZME27]|jgi:D-alanyl-D-alanine carboxypeptidase|uniref:D-alanyl-D-alanine carboxypeptidase n=1 Tax=Endobacterium cereale TaxID=2663029 RepID=A0A6A8A3N0_9HYPH|nr:D-alanyl-D-alanine carboxypeptidase family protein [Endobacterium cereale]MQY45533.1 D-alanyl-D-alanine carboxypeptidase [Endobacterium cereale]
MAMTKFSGRSLKAFVCLAALFPWTAAQATPILVVDTASHEVLYQEDAGAPWYPASTTKLMTALITFQALRSGEVTLKTPVVMTRNATRQAFLESGLTFGRTMTLEDALYGALVASANDVAVAIAEKVGGDLPTFIRRMNAEAQRLGMTGTHFASPNGLFDKDNYTTARDLAILGMEIEKQFPQYRQFFAPSAVTFDGKEVKSNNQLLTRYAGTIGMKTGFLCASGRNYVGLAERNGRQVMVVMLGTTTERERNERAAQYLDEAFGGRLPSMGRVETIANRADISAPDMRVKLCTPASAAYETERNAMYPMGLPGHESFLKDEIPGITHAISTWATENVADVPLPKPRPQEFQ